MKRINVMVSDEAKEIILAHKARYKFTTLDETVDNFIVETELPYFGEG